MRLLSRFVWTVAFTTTALSQAVAQNAFKEPWEGHWAFDVAKCADPNASIRLDRKKFDFSSFEAQCTVSAITKQGSTYLANVRCKGEGGTHNARLKLEVSGDKLTFLEQHNFGFYPTEFQRCEMITNRLVPPINNFKSEPNPSPRFINLSCRQGGCGWMAIKKRELVKENRNGKLLWISSLECYTSEADTDRLKGNICRPNEITESNFVVFCSNRFPAIASQQKDTNKWLRNTLSISQSGVFGYLNSSIVSYLYACHDVVWDHERGDNLDLIGAKLGYRPSLNPQQDQISSILDLMR